MKDDATTRMPQYCVEEEGKEKSGKKIINTQIKRPKGTQKNVEKRQFSSRDMAANNYCPDSC